MSVGDDERQANAASGGASAILANANPDQAISADGRWVAFASTATNLIPGESHPAGGIFVRDRQSGATQAVPWATGGPFPVGVVAAEPAISANGDVVAFTAVVGGGTAGVAVLRTTAPYVLVWDRLTGVTEPVSLDANNRATPGFQPSISADGLYVAYTRWLPNAPTPTPPPTPTPTPNPPPSLFGLATSLQNFCQSGSSTVTVGASDPNGIASVQIFYSTPGTAYGPLNMNPVGDGTYTYVIGSAGLAEGFVSITVRATDGQGAVAQLSNVNDSNHPAYLYAGSLC